MEPGILITLLVALGVFIPVYIYYARQQSITKVNASGPRESATPPLQSNDEKLKRDEPLPDPSPCLDFDINTTLTRDYIYANKPLRFPYFQTMAHQKMHIDNWIELDKDYQFYLDMKKRVVEEQGKVVMDSMPENDEACGELLEILVDYLPKVGDSLPIPCKDSLLLTLTSCISVNSVILRSSTAFPKTAYTTR